MLTGRCLCGVTRFEIHGSFLPTAYCHCQSCRRASGSAFQVNGAIRADEVRWPSGRESISEYESSAGKFRAFCRHCGSPIYARRVEQSEWLSIRLGLIDEDPGVRPAAHFNVSEKAVWHDLNDALPKYPGDEVT